MIDINVDALERLVQVCLMSKMAQQNSAVMTIRWLFLLLLVGDIANTLAPKLPTLPTLQERIEAYVAAKDSRKGKSRVGPKHLMFVDMDAEDTKRIVRMGVNLVFICDTFGAGCLFYLWECLTDNLYV